MKENVSSNRRDSGAVIEASNKADRIRTLYAAGLSVKDIAATVGCSTSYVRTAARQRIDGCASAADRKYWTSPRGRDVKREKMRRYWQRRRARMTAPAPAQNTTGA